MNQDPVSVDRVNWLRLFPGLHLLKAARMGCRLRILIPVYLAMLCSLNGPQIEVRDQGLTYDVLTLANSRHLEPVSDVPASPSVALSLPAPLAVAVTAASKLVLGKDSATWNCVGVLAWNLLLLSVFGVAIARATATEFCTGMRTGGIASLRFSVERLPAILLSAGIATGIVAVTLIPIAVASVFDDQSFTGAAIVMFVWVLLCLTAVLSVLAAIVCGLGWLLSIGAVGTDQCSGSDALSRGISYVLSHKLRTGWYLFVVATVSAFAKMLTAFVVSMSMTLIQSWLPISYGKTEFASVIATGFPPNVDLLLAPNSFILLLPSAVHFGAFLSGITIMYILLREAEDAVQMREIDGAKSG